MTIALDATYSIGDQPSGVGVYSREILAGLPAAHPGTRFEFWYRSHRYLRARGERHFGNVRRRLLAEPLGPRAADLFHGLNQRLPRTPLRCAVATFHDLFVMTGEYSTPAFRERFTAQARDAASRANAIIAVSEFTRRQVVERLGVPAGRVHVVHHGIRKLPVSAPRPRENVVLSVGAIQKRKNTARLVEAFETLDRSWRLVLAGGSGYGADDILRRIAASPARDRILVTGYIRPEDLAGWYTRASIFAFPSLDEGFGMPLLEAMAAGVAAIASDRSALPEVAGGAAVLVDPENGAALAQAMRDLAGNPGLRQELAERGIRQAGFFNWEKAVRETWQVYRAVLNSSATVVFDGDLQGT